MNGRLLWSVCAILFACSAAAQDNSQKKDQPRDKQTQPQLSDFLSDVTPGAVSAGDLVGLSQSAITEVQSSQDLILAIKPFSSDKSKNGFGLALTPGRSALLPFALVSTADYTDPKKWYLRPLATLTVSYAENKASISSVDYRKSGFSFDTSYYFNGNQDPIILGQKGFIGCGPRKDAELNVVKADVDWNNASLELTEAKKKGDDKAARAAQNKLDAAENASRMALNEANAALQKCVDASVATSPWNASRVAVSAGAAWIQREDNAGGKESLGHALTASGLYGIGKSGALYAALRRVWHEVDLTTLGTSPTYKSSSLVAVRGAYGSQDNGNIKVLTEVSNAKASKATESNRAFKYAVGLDAKLARGTWLEFRVGRSLTTDGSQEQTASLLTLNWAPSSSLFGK